MMRGPCSACLSTLIVFLQNHHSKLGSFRLQDGYIHIGIGKDLKVYPKGTILIGNCTAKGREKKNSSRVPTSGFRDPANSVDAQDSTEGKCGPI